MELIDTHAHLDFPRFKTDRVEVIKDAVNEGVRTIINVGADIASSQRAVKLSHSFSEIYATVGIHPHDADQLTDTTLQTLKKLAQTERVVAIGEIGLDYYYDNSPRDTQKEAFRQQLKLAEELKLPIVIHSREAETDTLSILQEMDIKKIGGVMHCFSGDIELAADYLDLNLYLAFGGILTFKNASQLQAVVREVPLSRILIETDAPYLTPHPYRGKRNEPAYVKLVAEKIAEIKKISLKEVASQTTENAREVFGLA